MADMPEPEDVIDRLSCTSFFPAFEAAAVDEDNDCLGRTRRRRRCKDVEFFKGIRPVSDIADDCHILVGLLVVSEKRRVELGGAGRVVNRADLADAFGDVRRHLRERHAGSGRQPEQRCDEEEMVHGDPSPLMWPRATAAPGCGCTWLASSARPASSSALRWTTDG